MPNPSLMKMPPRLLGLFFHSISIYCKVSWKFLFFSSFLSICLSRRPPPFFSNLLSMPRPFVKCLPNQATILTPISSSRNNLTGRGSKKHPIDSEILFDIEPLINIFYPCLFRFVRVKDQIIWPMVNLSRQFPCFARLQFLPDIIFVPTINCASSIKIKWRSNEKAQSRKKHCNFFGYFTNTLKGVINNREKLWYHQTK